MITLKISDLSYENSSKILFEDASLNITFHNLLICGRNGVGKTTLLELITSGHKQIELTQDGKRVSCGRLYQDCKLANNYSVKNNCLLFNVDLAVFTTLLTKLQPKIQIETKVKSLSGGQKQIINICMVLAKDYDIYLLDEPLNNLDKEVKMRLDDYFCQTDKQFIVVSHEPLSLNNYQKIEISKRKIIYENPN